MLQHTRADQHSGDLQVQDCQWRHAHYVRQWLGFPRTDLLYTELLPTRIRLLGCQIWSFAVAYYSDSK
jgi:hypothetical protein